MLAFALIARSRYDFWWVLIPIALVAWWCMHESGVHATIAGVVDGDAADDAGLAAGDTITRVGSETVTDAAGLTRALATMNPGDRVKVTWTTAGGATQSATVTLDASPVN